MARQSRGNDFMELLVKGPCTGGGLDIWRKMTEAAGKSEARRKERQPGEVTCHLCPNTGDTA